ncbi:hypothetical protein [Actinacidiphila acididurans]|uniref:Uncharacterized protein n=1 Tax=Actinacidiphila acididurans TaxID=2784346 RepID=A0ABS2U0C4_9ACTN|nr:hypothetical protein [Actinacidiphila acididurans]MBM9509053.1 hypothetical protein [Actinacidiphila acididurans]
MSVTWEWAELEGGPADGTRIRVTGRPRVLQVTADCPVEDSASGGEAALRVAALYIYRRKRSQSPLRYGWDWASP